MAQVVKEDFLKELLTHEVKELSRIKNQLNLVEHIPAIDNITLAVVPMSFSQPDVAVEAVKKVLRDSDVIFPGKGYLMFLLPGTDEAGAIHILEGVSEFMGEGLKFAYAVYPQDGETPEELIDYLKAKAKKLLGLDLPL